MHCRSSRNTTPDAPGWKQEETRSDPEREPGSAPAASRSTLPAPAGFQTGTGSWRIGAPALKASEPLDGYDVEQIHLALPRQPGALDKARLVSVEPDFPPTLITENI